MLRKTFVGIALAALAVTATPADAAPVVAVASYNGITSVTGYEKSPSEPITIVNRTGDPAVFRVDGGDPQFAPAGHAVVIRDVTALGQHTVTAEFQRSRITVSMTVTVR